MTDFSELKTRQQKAWSAGDYAKIGQKLVLVSEQLCETIDIRSGSRVLDLATGTGNTALAAARRNCDVIGIDFSSTLLEQARQRAEAEHLEVAFEESDAEDIPFPDRSFDVVLSTFGVSFTPDQEKMTRELLRVCRPGGKIGLTNWAPSEFTQAFDGAMASFRPPSNLPSPWLWGDASHVKKLFGNEVTSLEVIPRKFTYRYRVPEDYFQEFRTYYGPMMLFYDSLEPEAQKQVKHGLIDAIHKFNIAEDGTLVLPLDYVEIVAVKR